MDYSMHTVDNTDSFPDIYNLDNFNGINNGINNDNYYEINITFHNKGINTLTLNGEDFTHKIEESDFLVNFGDILRAYTKKKKYLGSYLVYIRQHTFQPIFIHRSNDSLHGMNDKTLLVGAELHQLKLYIPSSTRNTDNLKIILTKTNRYSSPDKINYLKYSEPILSIFSKYSEYYAFEIRTKCNSLHHTIFNKKILLPVKYNGETGEMECHVFSKIVNENVFYVFYVTNFILPCGNIIEFCSIKPCKYCPDYSKRFDICDESKYKLICTSRIIDIRMKLKMLLTKSPEITLNKNDLNIYFDKFGKDYVIKTYLKPF